MEQSTPHSDSSDKLGERLVTVVLDRLDKGLVRRQRAQRATHVGIDDLQAVDVAGIDPAEPDGIPN